MSQEQPGPRWRTPPPPKHSTGRILAFSCLGVILLLVLLALVILLVGAG
ncbi:hypothetical protein [Streptomyces sp. NPDC048269]